MTELRCPMGGGTENGSPTSEIRLQHENIFAERSLVGLDLLNEPGEADTILRRFEGYIRTQLKVAPNVGPQDMKFATRLDLTANLDLACYHPMQILTHDLLIYEREAALSGIYQFPRPNNVSLDRYQIQDSLREYPAPFATLLTAINDRFLAAWRQTETHAHRPTSPYRELCLRQQKYSQDHARLWNEREHRRAAANPAYQMKLVDDTSDPNDTLHYSIVSLRENVHGTFRNMLPWLIEINKDHSLSPRDISTKLLQRLGTITRPTGVKGRQAPHLSPLRYTDPAQGEFHGLVQESADALSYDEDTLQWTLPHLQDEKGPWKNLPHYEASSAREKLVYPYTGCIAFLPVPRAAWSHYIQAVEQEYDITITLRDPNGHASLSEILAAEMVLTLEPIMHTHPNIHKLFQMS